MTVITAGRSTLRQRIHPWRCAKHAGLYSDLLQAVKGEHLSALVFHRGKLISASAVPTVDEWVAGEERLLRSKLAMLSTSSNGELM